jgi:digeranylgeranylglycerophospholipid reductase
MIREHYDVVVIGAGPAGSVAARYAAEGGASVLMLERDREPGIPVRCGEGVSDNGIKPYIDIDPSWIAAEISHAKLVGPSGKGAFLYNNGSGYVLERRLFDTRLCEVAIAAGVTLVTKADATGLIKENGIVCGVEYTHMGETKTVGCKIVIGADGVESRVGRWAGMNTALDLKDLDTCVQYTLDGIDADPTYCEFQFGTTIAPGGYIWIFPKSNHSANVGIGIAGDKAGDKGPRDYLDAYVAERFPNASVSYTVYGGVPTAYMKDEFVQDNVILAGDAARQVNPITGGGIVQGMIGGHLAGETAAEAIKAQNYSRKFLMSYKKKWDKRLGNNQKTMYQLKEKFLGMTDEKFERLVDFIGTIPHDKFSLSYLFKEAVKEDPKLMVDIAKSFVVSKLKK